MILIQWCKYNGIFQNNKITIEINHNLFLHLRTRRPDNHTQPATQIPNASSSTWWEPDDRCHSFPLDKRSLGTPLCYPAVGLHIRSPPHDTSYLHTQPVCGEARCHLYVLCHSAISAKRPLSVRR